MKLIKPKVQYDSGTFLKEKEMYVKSGSTIAGHLNSEDFNPPSQLTKVIVAVTKEVPGFEK